MDFRNKENVIEIRKKFKEMVNRIWNNKKHIAAVIFIIFAVIMSCIIWGTDLLSILEDKKLSNNIQLWVCIGGLISVIYVIPSYIIKNEVDILNLKPILSLIVLNSNSKDSIHSTIIDYKNYSSNVFDDLTITVKAIVGKHSVSINDALESDMCNIYLGPHDYRTNRFITRDVLSKKGFDIDKIYREGKEINIGLSFKYTFLGKSKEKTVQSYAWRLFNDGKTWGWSIK